MFKNRFVLILAALAMSLLTLAVSQPFSKPSKVVDLSQPLRLFVVPVTGPEADQPYIMDSATRSYIARGEALQVAGKLGNSGACSNTTQENIFARIPNNLDSATRSYIAWGQAMQVRNAIDSATRSYIAWGEAFEKAKLNALDSGTRSYIAWGEALEAAGKLGESGTCSTTS